MKDRTIYCGGTTAATQFAKEKLQDAGYPFSDHAGMNVKHLLLDVPSLDAKGNLRSGKSLDTLLAALPHDVIIYGGNLNHPALKDFQTVDFLRDDDYIAANAAITADCALQVAAPLLTKSLRDSPSLVIGWGRIGKCLGQMLKAIGNDVTIAARKRSDRAMLRALGYHAADISELPNTISRFRLIFNTAPEKVLNVDGCKNCVKIDLASCQGLVGEDVVWARGLPGIHAPETSGELIAKTFIRLMKEDTK